MTMDSLRDFVRALEEAGELVRVRERVSTVKEITEVADRCMKSPGGGPALLFEHPVLPGGAVSAVFVCPCGWSEKAHGQKRTYCPVCARLLPRTSEEWKAAS